jgi:cytochrome c-type biogenesis protein CcmH/NrfG
MVEVELGEYIIEEQYDRQGEVPSYEENLELLEREEEDLVLSTREEEVTRFSVDRESEIIEMWSDMRMPREDITFLILL